MLNEHNPEEKASGLAILPEQPEVKKTTRAVGGTIRQCHGIMVGYLGGRETTHCEGVAVP